MTASTSDPKGIHGYIAELALSLQQRGFDGVRCDLVDGLVVLQGWVSTYEAKCRIEAEVLAEGFPIQNCLRVLPGGIPHPATVFPPSPVVQEGRLY